MNRRRNLLILMCATLVVLLNSLPSVGAQSSTGRSVVAFVTADYDTREMTISLIDPDNGTITPLVNDGYFSYPVLSPDGKYLAFMGEHPRSRTLNIYVIGTDGSNLHRLLEERTPLEPNGQVAWSPDSKQIIYGVVNSIDQPAGFFRVNLDGSNPEEIEFKDITEDFIDTWIASSPDGSRLAVLVQKLDPPYREIYVADADGSNAHPITATMADGQPFDRLVWSPDNQRALLNVRGFNSSEPEALMVADADVSAVETFIMPPPNYIDSVSWSPDGSRIVFTATELESQGIPDMEAWVVNADGSNLRSLNIPINVAPVGTSWSMIPDEVVLPSTPISFTSVAK